MKDEPNKITATLKVVVSGEFYDDEASEETLRYCVEQDLEDAGFDVDVELLKDQEAVEPILEQDSMVCGVCGHEVIWQKMLGDGIWADEELNYCPHCGRKVKWE